MMGHWDYIKHKMIVLAAPTLQDAQRYIQENVPGVMHKIDLKKLAKTQFKEDEG